MPRKTDRHATILKKLQNIIKHPDSNIAAGRRLTIERWVKTYIRQLQYLEDNKLQFLYNIFRDESCWSGIKLNNTTLGQRLTERSISQVENPLSRYKMACRYCVKEKIKDLFQEKFDLHKSRFSPDAVDDDGRPAASNNKYIRSDLLDSMESYDPVSSFWIDRESEELKLKEYGNVDGFREAVGFKWNEGAEHFYNHLSEQERKEEVTNAIIALSTIQCNYDRANVLDFCLHKMDNPTKRELLLKLSEKDQGVYSLLNGLIRWSFLDTVQDIVKRWCYEEVSVPAGKILSHQDYALLLSSLSNVMLDSPELSVQARSIFMVLWRCDRFNEHKKVAVDFSKNIDPITDVLAELIVDCRRYDDKDSLTVKKGEMLEILQFAKEVCSDKDFGDFKGDIIGNLRVVRKSSMKKNINYSGLAEELFSELDKKVSIPHKGGGDLGDSGDPQSMLEAPGVSGFPGHSR
ncbi:hypothetical protein [Wolbachia endosymbiont (group B) of Ischnura elegans]|uniref:hypothetical protein n=1 Tax=Wolbachia endosymbiont (group B) of Ischnura elegans TaxID=2954021 RepID=UPI00222EF0DD|nr:hypothetical protein [Wolbachia endosymbiont (group B) of Ischnura elegans]